MLELSAGETLRGGVESIGEFGSFDLRLGGPGEENVQADEFMDTD